MNDTQWIFEFEAYIDNKESRYEEYKTVLEVWKKMLIRLLGLDLMPIEEEEGGRLRLPTDDEIMPLSLIMGREEVVSTISKKLEEFRTQSDVDNQIETEEEVTLEEIEERLPDMVFMQDPAELKKHLFMKDPAIQKIHDAMVLPLDMKDKDDVKSNIADRKPKKSRVRIESEQ